MNFFLRFFAYCAAAGAAVLPTGTLRAEWLFYRGPTENGIVRDGAWSATFPSSGPKVLWTAELGTGLSSVTTAGGRVYSMGNKESKDHVYCFNAATGNVEWQYDYPLGLAADLFEGGPRATPTLDGEHVYTVSQQGDLFCFDAATGKKLWYKHYQQDFGGRRPQWGYAGSPLVIGNLVICDVGGASASTVALSKKTGEVVWKSGHDQAGYASPIVATLDGKQTVVCLKADALVGYDLKDGAELWRTQWKTDWDVNAATPLVLDNNRIFVSSGYNAGCGLYRVENGSVAMVWKNKNLRAHINTPVFVGGYLYGMDGNANGGNLVCLDPATGDRKWENKSAKGGSLISSNGKLIVLTEKGDLMIGEASPSGFQPGSTAKVLDKKCWVQPVLDGGRLYVKNNDGQLKCLSLSE